MDNYLMDTSILSPLNPDALSALDRPKPAKNVGGVGGVGGVGYHDSATGYNDHHIDHYEDSGEMNVYHEDNKVGGPKHVDEYDVQDQIDEYETEKFKGLVKKWITHDNNIRKLQAAMREQRKILKELTPQILGFMKDNEIDGLYDNEGGSTLQFKVTKRKETLSQKTIKEKLTAFLKSEDKADEATNFILSNRQVTDVVNLRRVFNKKSVLKL